MKVEEYRSLLATIWGERKPAKKHTAKRLAVSVAPQKEVNRWSGYLPFPPSVNHYWRHDGNVTHISGQGWRYRKAVVALLAGCPTVVGRLAVRIDVYPPDRRRRDLDNLTKGLLDALVHAGLIIDDSAIKDLRLVMWDNEIHKGGEVHLDISRITDN